MKWAWAALAAMVVAAPATAATQYAGVLDTSLETPSARVMKLSAVIKAPRPVLWRALTDATEMKRWNAPVAFADIRPGGAIEASYDPKAHKGEAQNIVNEIVAVDPGHMLVFRNVQAPKELPNAALFGHIVSTVVLDEAGPGVTRVTFWQVGYPGSDDAKPLYGFFHSGNAYLLANMNHVMGEAPSRRRQTGTDAGSETQLGQHLQRMLAQARGVAADVGGRG